LTVEKQNQAKTPEAKSLAKKYMSPWPRSPKHGKHALVQGDPNTRNNKK